MQADLAAELRPLLLDRLARTLERLTRELPGEETLPDEAALARLAGWQQDRQERLHELYATAQGAAGPRLEASLSTMAVDLNCWLLVAEADSLRHKQRGGEEGAPLRVAELLELAAAGAADLVEINALALADLAQGLHLPWLAVDAAAGWPWTAARPDRWAIYGADRTADTVATEPARLACWALRVLLRWTWQRSGAEDPAGLLPEEELATVGWTTALPCDAGGVFAGIDGVRLWADPRVGSAPFPFWQDWLPRQTLATGGVQPGGWGLPRTSPATGIIAFYAAWLASPETRAWETMKALAAADPGEVHHAIAGKELADADADDTDDNRRALAAALADELRRARKALELDGEAPPAPGARALPDCPGLFWLDELGARFLEGIGAEGEKLARAVREKAAERWQAAAAPLLPGVEPPPAAALWKLWLPKEEAPGGSLFAPLLARALWARREAERRKPAALIYPVHEAVIALHRRGLAIAPDAGAIVEATGQRVLDLVTPDTPNLPVLDLDTMRNLLAAGIQRMGSLTAQRLLRWEVVTGHRQALSGQADPRKIEVEGGWRTLAELIGERSDKARADLPGIVAVQACTLWQWPDGRRGNLLLYEERPAAPGRPAMVKLILGDMLLPGAVVEMGGRGRALAEGRRLVPMMDLLPPMAGKRANEQGPQAALHLAIMGELRSHARELAERGSVKIPINRWADLAAHVGLPRRLLSEVVEAWTRDARDAPAFLTRPDELDPWRFGLAKAYDPALAFLLAAGRRELGGAKGGKAATAQRAALLESGGRKRKRKPKPHSD